MKTLRTFDITYKLSPKGRKIITWTRFHETEADCLASIERIFRSETLYAHAVILNVEDRGLAHPLQEVSSS